MYHIYVYNLPNSLNEMYLFPTCEMFLASVLKNCLSGFHATKHHKIFVTKFNSFALLSKSWANIYQASHG